MKFLKSFFACCAVLFVFSGCEKVSIPADPIGPEEGFVVYGNVYTAEKEVKSVTAFAVRNGRFEYVGDMEGVEAYVGKDTKIYDYRDKGLILPGMCDAHAHYLVDAAFDVLARHGKAVRFAENTSYKDYIEGLRKFHSTHPAAERIFAAGCGTSNLGADRTAAGLDSISTEIPIMSFSSDLHSACVNSALIKKAGILNPDGSLAKKYADFKGGSVEFENGKPTGVLTEQLASYVFNEYFGLEFTDDEVTETVTAARDKLHSMGIVTTLDGWTNFFGDDKLYQKATLADEKNWLKLNWTLCYSIASWHHEDYRGETEVAIKHMNDYKGPHLRHNVKLFVDGIVESGTGYILGLYPLDPFGDKGHGEPNWEADKVNAIVQQANAAGEGVHCHVMGDAAVQLAVNAFSQSTNKDVRNSICHIRNIDKSDYSRIASLNVGCASATNWHSNNILGRYIYYRVLNEPYSDEAYPIASFFRAGIPVSHSSDCPCVAGAFLPFDCMEIAVTGTDHNAPDSSIPWWTDELLTADQALQALTINGAEMLCVGEERGSIRKGKYADFIVVNQDPRSCGYYFIHNTKVLATFFEGEQVFGN